MNVATREFIAAHLKDDVPTLALRKVPADVDLALALRQIEARQLMQKKVPSWSNNVDLLFPAKISIEQCSSESTAAYKAEWLKGDAFIDLTGGLGVDCFAISKHFKHSTYVETNADLCEMAKHNFSVLQASIEVKNAQAEAYLSQCEPVDCIFLDPARRDNAGRKVFQIADCTPDVLQFQEQLLQKAQTVMLKLSPMLDISQALKQLKSVKAVHVVAVANECKELLFVQERDYAGETVFHCVNLETPQSRLRFVNGEENDMLLKLADGVDAYLYEPNAALMKAGFFKSLAQQYDVLKLHRNSNLFTSDKLIKDFPGRVFAVEAWAPFGKKANKDLLAGLEGASITVRNFPMSAEELRKSLKLSESDVVFLFATTIKGDQKVLIKTKKA